VVLSGGEEQYRDHTMKFQTYLLFLVSIRRRKSTSPTQPAGFKRVKCRCEEPDRATKQSSHTNIYLLSGDCFGQTNTALATTFATLSFQETVLLPHVIIWRTFSRILGLTDLYGSQLLDYSR